MTFTGLQLAAILQLGKCMAAADGNIAQTEIAAMALEMTKFGPTESQVKEILKGVDVLSPTDAITVVSNLNNEQKKYVTGFLAVIMAADGKIEDSEVKMWQLLCTLASFPTMTIAQAVEFWKNY